MQFSLNANTYNISGKALPVKDVEKILGDAYGVELRDGYRFSLFDVKGKSLTWHSPQSGDTFECRRK